MGGSETNKTGKEKEPKTLSATTTQEQPAATSASVNPDWSGFQAYSPIPPHGFLAQSPQAPHPYMWGVQHIIPPYGTPPHPYVAMYPHGGMYAHPSIPPGSYPFSPFAMLSPNGIPETSGNTPGSVEPDTRSSDAKEKLPIKRSKGSLGSLNVITGKKHGKVRGTPANGAYKSAESGSGSEGSSEGSDANSQNDSQNKSGGGQDSLEDGSQNGGSLNGSQNGGQGTPSAIINTSFAAVPISYASPIPGPATNLNIGMDYWGAPAMHGKVSSTPMSGGIPGGSRDGVQPQIWTQDERELKRQRRKQSNRESARRSRLRKQAECDELAQRAGALKEENDNLRSEVNRIKSEYEKLLAENASLKETKTTHMSGSLTICSPVKERLGESSGQDDFMAGKSDQSPSNNTEQTG